MSLEIPKDVAGIGITLAGACLTALAVVGFAYGSHFSPLAGGLNNLLMIGSATGAAVGVAAMAYGVHKTREAWKEYREQEL